MDDRIAGWIQMPRFKLKHGAQFIGLDVLICSETALGMSVVVELYFRCRAPVFFHPIHLSTSFAACSLTQETSRALFVISHPDHIL